MFRNIMQSYFIQSYLIRSFVFVLMILTHLPEALSASGERCILGDPNSPVKIKMYYSLTCPHCAQWHFKDFNEIQKKYIDTKKICFEKIDYPTDALALEACKIAWCHGAAQYPKLSQILLHQQDRLFAAHDAAKKAADPIADAAAKKKADPIADAAAKKKSNPITDILAESNPDLDFNKCLDAAQMKPIENKILQNVADAAAASVKGVPAFFINGRLVEDLTPEIIEAELAKVKAQ